MIGYLSGPITGQKNYRQQFARAAGALKELGYIVINPAELRGHHEDRPGAAGHC